MTTSILPMRAAISCGECGGHWWTLTEFLTHDHGTVGTVDHNIEALLADLAATTAEVRSHLPEPTESDVLSDEEIAAADTATLRNWCESYEVSRYGTRVTVLEFVIDAEAIKMFGTLGVMDQTVRVILDTYADRGAEVEVNANRYSVSVWASDSDIRYQLRYEMKRRRGER